MDKKASFVCDDKMCTGCGLCVNMCPVNAIDIIDNLSFLNAEINKQKCINCNVCHSNCPQNAPIEANKPVEWYQGWVDNSQEREMSSSGGIGYALAKNIICKGGYVVSCIFEDGEFTFSIAHNTSDLSKFRGSKYVKSSPIRVYKSVKQLLIEGNTVLFIGLPCQVAGIKRYIGNSLETNLITVDLICHGSPSPKVLKGFLEQYSIDLRNAESISFRKKQNFSIIIDNKKICPIEIKDRYTLAFLNGLSYTENCYSCQYAKLDRVSDLTIGDSWGTNLCKEEKKGVSIIICQSRKGAEVLKESNINLHAVDLKSAVENNKQLDGPSTAPSCRTSFFRYIKDGKTFNISVFLCMPKDCVKQDIKRILLPILKRKPKEIR